MRLGKADQPLKRRTAPAQRALDLVHSLMHTPEAFDKLICDDNARLTRLFKEAGI